MDWYTHLHDIRRRELELIFAAVPKDTFASALELGAGDGYQAPLIAGYARRLTSTDYGQAPPGIRSDRVHYLQLDAAQAGARLAGQEFDLVFSSNMMEHIEEPSRVLAAIDALLAEGGLSIHVMPLPSWKAMQLVFFVPSRVRGLLRRVIGRRQPGACDAPSADRNNPAKGLVPRRDILWPRPHGASESNWAEFEAFSRGRWRREFAEAGFTVVAELPGPVASGYGFGLERVRHALERVRFATEMAYVTRRVAEGPSPYEELFVGSARGSEKTNSLHPRPPAHVTSLSSTNPRER